MVGDRVCFEAVEVVAGRVGVVVSDVTILRTVGTVRLVGVACAASVALFGVGEFRCPWVGGFAVGIGFGGEEGIVGVVRVLLGALGAGGLG